MRGWPQPRSPPAPWPGAPPRRRPSPRQGKPRQLPPGSAAPAPLDGQLINSAGRGDVGAVRRGLAGGAGVSARDQQGRTALIAAAYAGQLDTAQALIDAGADVDARDDTQQSAYLMATSEVGDDPRLLELTLAAGADVQAKDSYHGTGLIRAADRGHPSITARLISAGVQVDHVNRLGWTALLEAVILGDGSPRHTRTVRLLLDGGAGPQLADRDGITPLAHAQTRDQHAIAQLLRAGAPR